MISLPTAPLRLPRMVRTVLGAHAYLLLTARTQCRSSALYATLHRHIMMLEADSRAGGNLCGWSPADSCLRVSVVIGVGAYEWPSSWWWDRPVCLLCRILGEDKVMVEQLRPDLLQREVNVKADGVQTAFRKVRFYSG